SGLQAQVIFPDLKEHAIIFRHMVFFFQAEDGIRDLIVTGVQTCALPICRLKYVRTRTKIISRKARRLRACTKSPAMSATVSTKRSEERRVGKECRSRWWPAH